MEISDRYGFHAPSEVVFNNLTDPDRVYRWLPFGVRMQWRGPDRVRFVSPIGSTECQVDRVVEEKRMTVRTLKPPYVEGTARVEDDPAGGSRVHVAVNAEGVNLDPENVRTVLDETMHHLCGDVDDNFNTS
ncbi:SRPBCC family protein [Phytohabitans flavus]|nr:SRPBCC family protein [Phytohabitans flavus]